MACCFEDPETPYIYLGLKFENILEHIWLKSKKDSMMKDTISGVFVIRDKEYKEAINCLSTIELYGNHRMKNRDKALMLKKERRRKKSKREQRVEMGSKRTRALNRMRPPLQSNYIDFKE